MTTAPTLGAMRTVPAAVRVPAPGIAATRTALADGRTGRLLVRLAGGAADALSGRYLTPDDDIQALTAAATCSSSRAT